MGTNMGRWSVLVFFMTVVVEGGAAFAQGRGGAAGPGVVPNPGQLRAQPFSGAALGPGPHGRPASGPGAVPNPGQLPRQPFAGSPGAGFNEPYRGRRFSGATIIGDGLGFTTFGGDVAPDEEGLAPPEPRVVPGLGPVPVACPPSPLVLRVGRGLARPARTRVVYGAPPPCGPR